MTTLQKKQYDRIYYKLNRQKILLQKQDYQKKNKEKIKEQMKKYYKNNIEKIKAYRKQPHVKKRHVIEATKYIKNNINGRIALNLRNRMNYLLHKKCCSLYNLLACDRDYLIQHLQSQFTSNMSWDNYGNYWEIDHRVPCKYFDLTKENEQKKCFHYSNLRPLKVSINRSHKLESLKKD